MPTGKQKSFKVLHLMPKNYKGTIRKHSDLKNGTDAGYFDTR